MRKLFILSMIVFLMMSGTVHANDSSTYTEGTLYYTIQNGSITITGCFGKDEEVNVPSSIAGYPVNVIGKDAFSENAYVKKVNLPDTITQVEEGAFAAEVKVNYNGAADNEEKDDPKQPDTPETGKNDSNTQKNPETGKDNSNSQNSSETGKNDSNTWKQPETGKTDQTASNNAGSSSSQSGNSSQKSEAVELITANGEMVGFEEADVELSDEDETSFTEATEPDMTDETEDTDTTSITIEADKNDGKSKAPYIVTSICVLGAIAVGFVVWKKR